MTSRNRLLSVLAVGLALAGCSREGELVINEGVGIQAVRTACPAVGIPDYTGDITTFRAPGSTTLADLDVTAAITNLRSTCDEGAERVYTQATFDVLARRADTRGARTVTLPYFSTVLRGGSQVVTKRIGQVTLQFAEASCSNTMSANGPLYRATIGPLTLLTNASFYLRLSSPKRVFECQSSR